MWCVRRKCVMCEEEADMGCVGLIVKAVKY